MGGEVSAARVALATGAGLRRGRSPPPGARARAQVEAWWRALRGARRAFTRVRMFVTGHLQL